MAFGTPRAPLEASPSSTFSNCTTLLSSCSHEKDMVNMMVMARVVMANGMVEDAIVSSSLHASIVKGMVTS